MDWRARLWGVLDQIERLPHSRWVTLVATSVCLVLLLALIAASMRNLSLRQRLAERDGAAPPNPHGKISGWEDELPAISLEGEGRALFDRILPSKPSNFLWLVAVISVGCWILGFVLTSNHLGFILSPEWQLQPIYLAAHFITLRLFATMFTRNFLSGVAHLDMPPTHARRGARLVLGPAGAAVALVIAIPFCLYDYSAKFPADLGRDTNRLLFAMWCVEWFMMAFIWVQMLGFLLLTRWAVGEHRFRSPIEVVLLEKHYRPFLQMSAQGASIVLGFFLANAIYAWYTGGELTDYLGIAITLILLLVGFVPPWLQLTSKVDRAVKAELATLRKRLASSEAAEEIAAMESGQPFVARQLEDHLEEALVMLRISYLERLHRDLGNVEAKSIVLRVLVPATTLAYYAMHFIKG
jgi:hypothetical protein